MEHLPLVLCKMVVLVVRVAVDLEQVREVQEPLVKVTPAVEVQTAETMVLAVVGVQVL
jgi:hypothetical protein